MTVTKAEWDNVISQTTLQIDRMTVSLEIQKNILKFAQERVKQYPKEKPIVEPVEPKKSDKDVGITQ